MHPSTKYRLVPTAVWAVIAGGLAAGAEPPAVGTVTLSTEFPGGNATVESVQPGRVHVAPDLRGDRPWFYWYFEATAVRPGRVTFAFPEKVAGFVNGAIGYQGPAVSTDQGVTWAWMGTETVDGDTFTYDFREPGEVVRFAVTIPYVQSTYEAFLKRHAGNSHLKSGVLTKSRDGRDVEMLSVGEPGPGKAAVLLTCRHHAVETMASYLLEGMIAEAIADTPDGKAFRDRYTLTVVPFIDKDGVEAGDQGKNRKPHDHNRDYGDASIYPEARAIKALQEESKFRFALDLHCPTLVMKDHQVCYFVGAKDHPPHNQAYVAQFAERIKTEWPDAAPVGPLVWLRNETEPSPKSSRYFAFQPGVVMSATLEFPFAPPKKEMSPAACRKYGRGVLRAFTATQFAPPEVDR